MNVAVHHAHIDMSAETIERQLALTVKPQPRLTLLQRFMMKIAGHVYLGHQTRSGWRGGLPFYAFRCPEHGVVVDYPHGFGGRLTCPHCTEVERPLLMTPSVDVDELGVEVEAHHT